MKKLISLLLALVMVLSLAACGGNSKTPDSGSPPVMTAAAAPLTAASWNTWTFPWVTGM